MHDVSSLKKKKLKEQNDSVWQLHFLYIIQARKDRKKIFYAFIIYYRTCFFPFFFMSNWKQFNLHKSSINMTMKTRQWWWLLWLGLQLMLMMVVMMMEIDDENIQLVAFVNNLFCLSKYFTRVFLLLLFELFDATPSSSSSSSSATIIILIRIIAMYL